MDELCTYANDKQNNYNYNNNYYFRCYDSHLGYLSAPWDMVVVDGIIGSSIVGNEECPASVVTTVLITTMEDIAMEEECISCL